MSLPNLAIAAATLLCSLVAGFLFSFAVVVMPGINKLRDREFLNSFKEMDRVIQNNQPLFMFVWLGSIATLVLAAIVSVSRLEGIERLLILTASGIFLLGVQLPTIAINIPLNKQLQSHDLDKMDEPELARARSAFEPRWIRWNSLRTFFAILTSFTLIAAALTV